MKENNTDVSIKDPKEEKMGNREEGRTEYKGEELSMGQDTLTIDKHASEDFQSIKLKRNQEYLEDKKIREKDDNRLKLKRKEIQTEEGHRQRKSKHQKLTNVS